MRSFMYGFLCKRYPCEIHLCCLWQLLILFSLLCNIPFYEGATIYPFYC